MVTLTTIVSVFGLWPTLTANGFDYPSLALFCLIWGMGGSVISLLMSRASAKWSMGVELVSPDSPGEGGLLARAVHDLCQRAGLRSMPQVGIYNSPEVNAFATGPTRSRSLVAVSSGLLRSMNRTELEGVLAHEIAHIKNGDMVTLTLLQGVINAFTLFLSRIIAVVLTSQSRDNESRQGSAATGFVTVLLEMVLGFLGYLVVCWFSRYREFRADSGSTTISGTPLPMIQALQALQARVHDESAEHSGRLAAFKISGGGRSLMRLFSTHPPLEERIAKLLNASTPKGTSWSK